MMSVEKAVVIGGLFFLFVQNQFVLTIAEFSENTSESRGTKSLENSVFTFVYDGG